MNTSQVLQKRQELSEHFSSLNRQEKCTLQILSIIYLPISRTKLFPHLRDLQVKTTTGQHFTAKALSPIINQLKKLKLLLPDTETETNFYCNSNIEEEATRSAIKDGVFDRIVDSVRTRQPISGLFYYFSPNRMQAEYKLCIREIRIGLFSKDLEHVEEYLLMVQQRFPQLAEKKHPLVQICANPFIPESFSKYPLETQVEVLGSLVITTVVDMKSPDFFLPVLKASQNFSEKQYGHLFRRILVILQLLRGELSEAEQLLQGNLPIANPMPLLGWLYFLKGDNETALECYELSLSQVRKATRKRKVFTPDISGLFFFFAILKAGKSERFIQIADHIKTIEKQGASTLLPAYRCFSALCVAQENHLNEATEILDTVHFNYANSQDLSPFTNFFKQLVQFWIDHQVLEQREQELLHLLNKFNNAGYQWPAMEMANLLAEAGIKTSDHKKIALKIQMKTGMQSVLSAVKHEDPWERALASLTLLSDNKKGKARNSSSRMVWLIDIKDSEVSSILPREQVMSKKGTWSKGRAVAMKRLFSNLGKLKFLTEQDIRIASTIKRNYDYYGGTEYYFNWETAMLAMVGHPLVFWAKHPAVNVEVIRAEPELLVKQQAGRFKIEFAEAIEGQSVIAVQESPTRCKIIEINKAHKQISEIIGGQGLKLPKKGKDQLLQALQSLSSMVTIHSTIAGGKLNIKEVTADPTPHMHLLPYGEGLKVKRLVRPFSNDGSYFEPGEGGKTIIAEINGERLQTRRSFKKETQRAEAAIATCPSLGNQEGDNNEWIFEEPDDCLELLMDLKNLKKNVVLEWPEGEKFKIAHHASMDQMRVQIKQDKNWFALSGELKLDESLILEMSRLLDLVQETESRFIPIGDGAFIALTQSFRDQLSEIQKFSDQKKGVRFHALAAPILEEFSEEVGHLKSDKHWKSLLKRIQNAQSLDPQLPSTLQAELRDYQVEGFRWLMRLASWGVGGCLADDMGLGKTLQALAAILSRAPEGPSLVIAPSSVCLNWKDEIFKFTPTLNCVVFGGQNRKKLLAGLKEFDVLICSYGLLQQGGENLANIDWNTIVLDEAQSIKNRLTKRSKAAMTLNGKFKLLTTGTPIENHLGELWNLFQFINPGLLGSLSHFNEHFATPIERFQDKSTRKQLKKLISPFILRRTKTQVLQELPPRTEIVLHVEMTSEESSFYETLRRRAVQQLENMEGSIEENRFQILAEIMRLRRACCNSRLVLPESPVASSKLDLFWKVVEELLGNHHKALVFSQFVGHLDIIRELLDKKGITYQYLDGSTPVKERKRRIDAFQAGEGELFLISLRAGGMGINLTAADYVIHMDPWWNPAVEDQASDRAHRIGQKRPVTIYRLIVKESIEERIAELHQQKRKLADGLLDGSDMSGKISAKELLQMIQTGGKD